MFVCLFVCVCVLNMHSRGAADRIPYKKQVLCVCVCACAVCAVCAVCAWACSWACACAHKIGSFSPVLLRHVIGQVTYGRGRKGTHKCWKQSLVIITLRLPMLPVLLRRGGAAVVAPSDAPDPQRIGCDIHTSARAHDRSQNKRCRVPEYCLTCVDVCLTLLAGLWHEYHNSEPGTSRAP